MAGRLSRKRKLLDGVETDDYSGGIEDEISKFGQHSASGRQHTIDSDEDEEDDDDYNKRKHNVMDEEEIEGQEDGTLDFDGETKITPFNMKDELEEGYFDGNGMYIWNKRDASEVKDSWLDSIDWMKVQPKKGDKSKKKEGDGESSKKMETEDDDEKNDKPVDVLALYKQMLLLLQPRETVLKAIKRLGAEAGKPLSASERLKQKKQAAKLAATAAPADSENNGAQSSSTDDASSSTTPQQQATDNVTKLTELADSILSATGNMDVYQETFESVTFKIKREESKKTVTAVNDDEDMFGDSFEAKKDDAPSEKNTDGSISDASEVKWEFKWEDKEEAPIYGPHTSLEMHSWVSEGYFKDGVFVRKYKQDARFYSSKRIDFELYC